MRFDHARAMLAAAAISIFFFPLSGSADVVVSTMTDPGITVGTEPEPAAVLRNDSATLLGDDAPELTLPSMRAVDAARLTPTLGVIQIDYTRAFLDGLVPAKGGAEWECLTEALYFEARGETVAGIFAVAEVILNRVDSSRFPSTVCGVVRQGTGRKYQCQFSYLCDGRGEVVREPHAYRAVGKVARVMLDGAPRALTGGAQFYHTRQVSPRWSRVFDRTTTIGAHHFYAQG